MKNAKKYTFKWKIKRISRDLELVQTIGEMRDLKRKTIQDLPLELREEYDNSKNPEACFLHLRKAIRDEVLNLITTKKLSAIALVKYYSIFTDSELNTLFSKHSSLENVKKLIIIDQIEKLLIKYSANR